MLDPHASPHTPRRLRPHQPLFTSVSALAGWCLGYAPGTAVYPDAAARDRAALVSGRLLIAEGQVERATEHAEVLVTRLIVRRLTDCSDLLDGLADPDRARAGTGDGGAWADRAIGRADEVRRPEPGGRKPPGAKLPASRDFC